MVFSFEIEIEKLKSERLYLMAGNGFEVKSFSGRDGERVRLQLLHYMHRPALTERVTNDKVECHCVMKPFQRVTQPFTIQVKVTLQPVWWVPLYIQIHFKTSSALAQRPWITPGNRQSASSFKSNSSVDGDLIHMNASVGWRCQTIE